MTYYDVLQVPSHASADAIRTAYRAMAKRYHPDANPLNRNVAAAQFRVVQDAYDHLRDPDRRRAYDQTLRARAWVNTSAANDTSSADDFFTSARRTLERLMRLMASTRDVTVKGDHHG